MYYHKILFHLHHFLYNCCESRYDPFLSTIIFISQIYIHEHVYEYMVGTMFDISSTTTRPPKRSAFLKLLVLNLLRGKQMHGYEIMKELERIFGWHTVNPGVLYRLMRNLKNEGFVKIVEERERGKKVYEITSEGVEYLKERKEDLNKILEKIARIREVMKIGGKDLIGVISLLVENISEISTSQKDAIKEKISEFVQTIWNILETKGEQK
ncbi:MAG TPA: PadR family transcriptional regulator [Thermoplasmatales archaeon]|nr:PadR family transcriptional regulator [Thermoplasmatales archaeon]